MNQWIKCVVQYTYRSHAITEFTKSNRHLSLSVDKSYRQLLPDCWILTKRVSSEISRWIYELMLFTANKCGPKSHRRSAVGDRCLIFVLPTHTRARARTHVYYCVCRPQFSHGSFLARSRSNTYQCKTGYRINIYTIARYVTLKR